MDKVEKIVPDTSVIIEGLLSERIENKEIEVSQVIIHEAVISELEHQANLNKATGYLGLEELHKLREKALDHGYELIFSGKKPSAVEIKYAKMGEIDAMIRDLAFEQDATLMTADKIQEVDHESLLLDLYL